MEKEKDTGNPREGTLLFQLFKIMVQDFSLSEKAKERIRKKLKDKIKKENN